MTVGFSLLGAFIGAVAGSTATALQDRYQNIRSFVIGRSICPNCKRTLTWFELFPIVSWLLFRGRCRTCHASIGWESFAIEVTYAIVGFGAVYWYGPQWWLLILAILFVVFGALVLIDMQQQLLPDVLILAAIPLLLIVGLNAPNVTITAIGAIEGLLIAGGTLGLLWLLTKGDGIGDGDVKLAAVLGLGLGPSLAIVSVMSAFILGGVLAAWLLITKRAKFGQRIAFGPLLIIGYAIALFAGPFIIAWYSY